jgi:hypothetical protein
MDELSKTYTLSHSRDGWRVNFSTGIAPGFGLEPHHNLFEVLDRVETLYPEYLPRLTVAQLADYQLQVARRGHAQELQKIISQTSELRDGLIGLTKNLPAIGAARDGELAEDLATLHHQLSDLRAHVDVARREVGRAKRVGQSKNGIERESHAFRPIHGFITGVRGASIVERRGMER